MNNLINRITRNIICCHLLTVLRFRHCQDRKYLKMEYNNQNQESQFHEEEIDIIAILKRLWEKRTFIIKVACVFVALGVFVAIFTPNEY
ncbi:MAG: hypothetical protein II344_04660, partial [Bacteroidales bacterium]|nr:hypothetical protein [Bacteroidales bacterium]